MRAVRDTHQGCQEVVLAAVTETLQQRKVIKIKILSISIKLMIITTTQ